MSVRKLAVWRVTPPSLGRDGKTLSCPTTLEPYPASSGRTQSKVPAKLLTRDAKMPGRMIRSGQKLCYFRLEDPAPGLENSKLPTMKTRAVEQNIMMLNILMYQI